MPWGRPCRPRPFPFAPLEELMLAEHSAAEMMRTLRISSGALRRARALGLSYEQADVWAIRAGFHPAEIWPQWWEAPI